VKIAGRIVDAVRGAGPDIEGCLIAVSGDVAFSGTRDQYTIATDFFRALRAKMEAIPGMRGVGDVYIPGNHDCAFPAHPGARAALLKAALDDPAQLADDESIASACLVVQDDFFAFVSEQTGTAMRITANERLRYNHVVDLAGLRIVIRCYNTAWMSRLHEQPAQLLAPTWIAGEETRDADLVVSMFHHPYGWLRPENSRELRAQVEPVSDIVLTGHEHRPDQRSVRTICGDRTEWIEGAVLHGGDPLPSGFNLVLVDPGRREQRTLIYEWRDDHYAVADDGDWQPFQRHRRPGRARFEPTLEYKVVLTDAGAPFTHPQKATLTLADIFVYPDLADETNALRQKRGDLRVPPIVRSENVFTTVRERKHVLIMGGEKSGKTSIGKALYADFLASGIVPVLIDGGGIRVQDGRAAARLVDARVAEQYGTDMAERYRQRDAATKAAIVDDYQRARLGQRGQDAFLSYLEATCGIIVLIADESFQVDELVRRTDDRNALLYYSRWDIKEFGHHLRAQLIEKWLTLGETDADDERAAVHRQDEVENLVTSIIGKNLLPAYPIFVLTILQMTEANTAHSTALGSFGYYYDVLITTALETALVATGRHLTIDTLYTVVAAIAYRQFELKRKYLTDDELDDVLSSYRAVYRMAVTRDDLTRILSMARIYRSQADDQHGFQYKYIYYYFVARHMAEALRKPASLDEIREHLDRMAGALHVEDYANILLFFVYFTRDEDTIERILAEATTLYATYPTCDMDTDLVGFAPRTPEELPLALGATPPHENRRERRQELDRAAEALPEADDDEGEALVLADDGERELNEALRLNVAIKTLQIMGQILRNFPGALDGETKRRLALESYALGLRATKATLAIMGDNIDTIEDMLATFVREVDHIEDAAAIEERVSKLLSYLALVIAFGFIKRISQAVGSEHLKETFKDVIASDPSTAAELIDIAIKLDHHRVFPEAEADRLHKKLRARLVPVQLLRQLVFDHLYLFPVPARQRQSICAKLNIKENDPRLIDHSGKRVG